MDRNDAPTQPDTPTPPREDRAATEPATVDACKADYRTGAGDRAAIDRDITRRTRR